VHNSRVNRPTLYLICGLPGAGKTTRSVRIAELAGAVHLAPDEWIVALGVSLVDFEFRIRFQDILLQHAGRLLACGVGVVVEFGSWHREERERIRQVAAREGAGVELHFLDAPLEELVRRVRARGGPDAELLASQVLLQESGRFERPTPDEIARFDRYFGPGEAWQLQ